MNEREILEKSIEEHQTAIDTAKDKLAELDKPKQLRHGDYHYHYPDDPVFYLGGEWWNRTEEMANGKSWCQNWPYQGNLIDDLRRNSEDLREFVVGDYRDGDGLKIVLRGDIVNIYHSRHGSSRLIQFKVDDGATEIHQKLGQVIATAKREKNG